MCVCWWRYRADFCLLKVLFLQAVTQWLKYVLISFCGLINGRDKVHWYPGIKLKIDKKWTYYGTFFEYFRLFRHVDAQVREKSESLIHSAHVYTSETHTHSHTTSSVGLRTIFDKSRERVGARPEPGRAEPSWARRGGAVVGGWWWGRGSRGAAGCLAPRRQRRARLAGRRLMPRQDSLPRWWSNNTDGSVSVPTSSPAPTPSAYPSSRPLLCLLTCRHRPIPSCLCTTSTTPGDGGGRNSHLNQERGGDSRQASALSRFLQSFFFPFFFLSS